ncbi:MAG: CocE/NonD family hydrolase [Chlamydiales bacterium]|nr:CocE/NonD family hydrolase [Chlamydiia bacterium]MCP5507510.1 CocE/NonD family hydrolase [Chlamydiales bacterium]
MRPFTLFLVALSIFVQPLVAGDEPIPAFTIMVPMRDGTELPTDIYLPDMQAKGLPCILLRSTAGRKAFPWREYAHLTKLGYCVAIQDTRSAIDPEGKTIPFWADGWGVERDGYDAVEWLASSIYTNGKIGTIGFSQSGITQQMMAPTAPPSLKCQYIGVAPGSLYHYAVFNGGQFLKAQVESWMGYYARDPSHLSYMRNQPYYNAFWDAFDAIKRADQVCVPAMHYSGWYDIFVQGTIDNFTQLQEHGGDGARGKQKLVIGPWTHFWPSTMKLGDFEVPANAQQMPMEYLPQNWFAYYLKGEENNIDDLPSVMYYTMGPLDGSPSKGNVWHSAASWPPPSTQTAFYLTKDMTLTTDKQSTESEIFVYDYDPNDHVPTRGGRNLFIESGPMDQQEIESRSDVYAFTSQPLNQDTEVTGRLHAKLFISSTHADTDVIIRLCDVYPDGRSILISDAAVRTGTLKKNNTPQQVIPLNFDLWSTSLVFAKGHRIRLSVSSSNYPRYEKNHNLGILTKHNEPADVATNAIHVGGTHASHLMLPIVER